MKTHTGIVGTIRTLRRTVGITQQKLAEEIGLSHRVVSNLECGIPVSVETIRRVLEHLRSRIEVLKAEQAALEQQKLSEPLTLERRAR